VPDISELAFKIGTFLECMGGVGGGWKVSVNVHVGVVRSRR
jgi:hypothetical protein